MNELPYETKARGMARGADAPRVRGRDGGRWTDTIDREIADALDETARRPLCAYHAGRAADRPPMVRETLWRGLVARWAKAKCGACRGIPDAPPAMDDAGLDAVLRDVRAVHETRRAGRADDAEGRASGLERLKRAVLGARDETGADR